jgi:hypothetical protein
MSIEMQRRGRWEGVIMSCLKGSVPTRNFAEPRPTSGAFAFLRSCGRSAREGTPKISAQMGAPSRPILRRHILDVSRDVPLIAKSVLHASAAITVRLVLRLRNGGRSYCQRAPVERVAIGNV